MNKLKEKVFEIREEILALRKLDYPEIKGTQAAKLLPFFIQIRYNSIDFACSVLQGAYDFSEPLPSGELRKNIEQTMQSSGLSMLERKSISHFLEKIDLVTNSAKELLILSREAEVNHSQDSLSHLSETVYIAQGQLDAESMHLFLDSYGFKNRVLQESAGVVLALTVGILGEAEIRVALEDAEQARKYIQAMKSGVFMFSELEEVHLQSVFPDEVEGDMDNSDDF